MQHDMYDMANLFPADTGLPVTVWISVGGYVLAEPSTPEDVRLLCEWVQKNHVALLHFWDGVISAAQFFRLMQQI